MLIQLLIGILFNHFWMTLSHIHHWKPFYYDLGYRTRDKKISTVTERRAVSLRLLLVLLWREVGLFKPARLSDAVVELPWLSFLGCKRVASDHQSNTSASTAAVDPRLEQQLSCTVHAVGLYKLKHWQRFRFPISTEHDSREGKAIGSVRPSVRLFVFTLYFEPTNLWTWVARLGLTAKVIGQGHGLGLCMTDGRYSKFLLSRHQLRVSAARRTATAEYSACGRGNTITRSESFLYSTINSCLVNYKLLARTTVSSLEVGPTT